MIAKRSTAALLIAVSSALLTSMAGAQVDPWITSDPSDTTTTVATTTTVPAGANPSSTVPATTPGTTPGTTAVPGSTTTTTIYVPPVPPELQGDPRLPFLVDPGEDDPLDIPVAQLSFDPGSVGVLPERVEESKKVLAAAQQALQSAQVRSEAFKISVAGMEAQVSALKSSRRGAVERAAAARKRLRDQAVDAYVRGRSNPKLTLVDLEDASDIGVAREYMGVLMDSQNRLAREYDKLRKSLSSDEGRLAEALGIAKSKQAETRAEVERAFEAVIDANQQLAAYEAGAHAYVKGFVFPVAAEVEFIDSWGFPRMTGTSYQHWHQGTDIFAPLGAPVLASENGVIDRLGTAVLGGNKLWVKGNSGTSYYYAHLAAFAPGIAEGDVVTAGQVVGFVGDTGNAKGTSPHLHFEVHPNGGDVVNGYPLLKAAYGNRPMVRATGPIPAPPALPAAPGAPVPAAPGG
ncbi:MAG: M23 family metallopeptidase [Microthrixaceae bacterium]